MRSSRKESTTTPSGIASSVQSGKLCNGCGKVKPVEGWHRNKNSTDGLAARCKVCHSIYYSKYSQKNQGEIAQYNREYREKNREKLNAYDRRRALEKGRKQYARNPEKVQARRAVYRAIADGRLIRRSCELCGHHKSHAHHTDYSKQLDVHWLCAKCHGLQHRRTCHGELKSDGEHVHVEA